MNQQQINIFKSYLNNTINDQIELLALARKYDLSAESIKHEYCLRVLSEIRGVFERTGRSNLNEIKENQNDD